jgi:hypothetical protein
LENFAAMSIKSITDIPHSSLFSEEPPRGSTSAITKIVQRTLAAPAATSSSLIKVTAPENSILAKAKKYGYIGIDQEEAEDYISDLRAVILLLLTPSRIGQCRVFSHQFVFYIVYKSHKALDAEQTLEKIFHKTTEPEIYQFIIDLVTYSSYDPYIRTAFHGPSLVFFLSELLRIKAQNYPEEARDARLVEKACLASSKMEALPSMRTVLMLVLRAGRQQNQLCLTFVTTENDFDLLKVFSEEGVVSHLASPTGHTPLHTAAMCGNADFIKWHLDNGADIEARNSAGNRAMHFASYNGNIEAIETLRLRGAKLYAANHKGLFPFNLSNSESFAYYLEQFPTIEIPSKFNRQKVLYQACGRGYSNAVKVLLSENTPVDQMLPGIDFSPMDWALAHGRFKVVRQILNFFGWSYEVYLENKFLAHVFELKGSTNRKGIRINYEGFNRELASHRLSSMATAFIDENNTGLTDEEKRVLKEAFQAAPHNLIKNPEELVSDISEGKPVVLYTGWNTHITAVLFHKKRVLKFNRGEESGPKPGIEVFTRTKTDLLSSVRDLQVLAQKEEGMRFFLYEMHVRLGLIEELTIELNAQTVGNCGWATSEALFAGVLFSVLSEKTKDAVACAIDICNQWIHFVRHRSFHGYLIKVAAEDRDYRLLNAARQRLQNPVSIQV